MTEWWTTRSMPAAVAIGLAKMCSHWEKTRLDVMPSDLRSWRSAMSRGQEVVQLAQPTLQIQVPLGCQQFSGLRRGRLCTSRSGGSPRASSCPGLDDPAPTSGSAGPRVPHLAATKGGPGAGRLPRPVPLLEEELGIASAGGGPVPNLQTKRALQAKPAMSPGISNQESSS